jgi:uncharacterized repeat protein (TIGR03943 family)
MTRAGGTITALVGVVVLRLTLAGTFQRYVRTGMKPWLLIAGAVLVVLGVTTLVRALRKDTEPDDDLEQSRVGWLLLAPIAALLLVAPPTLGSFGVDRASPVDVRSGGGGFKPLTASANPVPMTLLEYGQRAFDGDGKNLAGATVKLTGFIATGADAGSFRLARYQIACCAADAAAAIVRVSGFDGAPPPQDQWVTVTGVFKPSAGETPEVTATGVQQIPVPEDPYE